MTTDANPVARKIRLAQRRAARRLFQLLNSSARELREEYLKALEDIQRELRALADADGTLPLHSLRRAEAIVADRINALAATVSALVGNRLRTAITSGSDAWSPAAGQGVNPAQVAEDVLQFVTSFVDSNGLQLSDRLWRVNRQARQQVTEALERAVIQGHSATQAARDLLLRSEPVPQDLLSKQGMAAIDRVQREMGDALLTNQGNPYYQAERVMRTEINRAYGETALQAAAQHPDAIAVRFRLSPLHPEPDICDFHAEANLHGLGPGAYPIDDHPWPAHPNTLSYVEPIFRDEITAEDRDGQQTIKDYLNSQPAQRQDAILGGKAKGWAWREGHLSARQIKTPWHQIRAQLQRRGIDIPERFAR